MNKNRWRNREILTIGQMSKICGVSVKTLRHYEKIGLLRPGRIDEASGYRYYEDSQISTMLSAGRLERCGFSSANIRGLLNTRGVGSLLGQLRKQEFRLEQRMNYLPVTIREMGIHLEEFEKAGDIMSYQNSYEIQVRKTEEQALVISRQNMSVEKFRNYCGEPYERIAREHLVINGVTMAIYHDQEFDPAYSDIELAVGITKRDEANYIVPKRLCTAIVHRGAYSGLPDTYGAIVSQINASRYWPDGTSYEIYVENYFHSLSPEEWRTKIPSPIKK